MKRSLALVVAILLNSSAHAATRPLSVKELQSKAGAIVIATVEGIRSEAEPSHFEPGIGNSDWGIYLKLKCEKIEKGDLNAMQQMEARCFRIRSRRSFISIFSTGGHRWIPEVGTRVRVYVEDRGGTWNVVLPNGIATEDGKELEDAREVEKLRGRRLGFTFFLPLELWFLLMTLTILLAFWVRRYRRRATLSSAE